MMIDARVLILAATVLLAMAINSANAGLTVRFEEDAPKDRFIFTNATGCDLKGGKLIIDLSTSPSGLLFDTSQGGPGENVAQPLAIASAEKVVGEIAPTPDGGQTVEITFRSFSANGRLVITADVDDSVSSGPRGVQMIAGGEMKGARVSIERPNKATRTADFNHQGEARLASLDCSLKRDSKNIKVRSGAP